MFSVDERIEALFDDDENWYPATLDIHHYDVEYDDGDFRAAVPLREIRYSSVAETNAGHRLDSMPSSTEGRATQDDDIQAPRTNDSMAGIVDGILADETPTESLHPKTEASRILCPEINATIPNLSSVDGGIIDDGMDDILDGILNADNNDSARLGESTISQQLARALSETDNEYADDYEDSDRREDDVEATAGEASESRVKLEAHKAKAPDILSPKEEQNRSNTYEPATRDSHQLGPSYAARGSSSTEERCVVVSCESDCTENIDEGYKNSCKIAVAPMPANKPAQNNVKLAPLPEVSPEIKVTDRDSHGLELDLATLAEGKSDSFVAMRVDVTDEVSKSPQRNLHRSSRSPQPHIRRLSRNQQSNRHSMTLGMRMTHSNHASRRPKSANLARSNSSKLNRVRPLSGIHCRETKSHTVIQVLPDVVADTSVPHRGWDGLKRWLDEEFKLQEAAGFVAEYPWIGEAHEHIRPKSAPRSRSMRNGATKPRRNLRALEEGFDLRFRSPPPMWDRRSRGQIL